MKKKSCLTLALILVMVQLLSVFAILPVGADNAIKTYDVKKSNVAPTVDGTVDAIWGFFEPTGKFTFNNNKVLGNYAESTTLAATAKLLYVENGDLIDVYVLIETKNTTAWSSCNRTTIVVNDTPIHLAWSGGGVNNVTNASYNYVGASLRVGSNGGVYEHHFQLTAEQAQSVKFDMYVLDGGGNSHGYTNSDQGCYSWGDTHAWNATVSSKGTLTFSDTVNYPKTASVYRSAFAPVVDGQIDTIWNAFDASDKFIFNNNKVQGNYAASTTLTATAKILYVENGDLIDVYVLIETKNTTAWSSCNRTTIVVNDTPIHLAWSGGGVNNVTNASYNYVGASLRVGNNGGVYEHHFQLTAEQAQSVKFDMYVLDGGGNSHGYTNSDQGCYSWADTHAWNATVSSKGTLNFVDEDVISVESAVGASVRVDTTQPKQSGIRFATTVDASRLAALEAAGATVTTGTLVLPTNNLKNVTDFTKEGLTAAGLVEGAHYYDIVNEGNEWIAGEEGTWYGTLYDIKNFTRQFSAIGYVTVTIDGVSVTYYGQYEDSYARSVADVADAALKDTGANWSTDEIDILNGFCGK